MSTFEEHLKKYLSDKEINDLIKSFSSSEQKGLLLNEKKMSKNQLLSLFPNLKTHPVIPNAFLYDENEYKMGKKVYHELGAYYIQDPSAMLVSYFLGPQKDKKILDLCAAPGGKTIGASLLNNDTGIIYSNDISSSRVQALLSNIERMGLGNVVVLNKDFSKYENKLNEYFDAIILDAPCSGSGMFRKSNEMLKDWTYEKVLKYSAIQKELILMAFKMLKPGGTLMYSTCSYSYEEDEEVIEYLLENSPAKLQQIEHFDGELRSKKYPETVHLFSSYFKGEGQYIAKIIKPGILTKNKPSKLIINRKKISKGNALELETFKLNLEPNQILIIDSIRPGLLIDKKIGKDTIYSHHYSHYIDSKESINLTEEELIKYLRGESLKKDIQDGYQFVSYLGMNVGVTHVVKGELKNLYPKGLRINASIRDSF